MVSIAYSLEKGGLTDCSQFPSGPSPTSSSLAFLDASLRYCSTLIAGAGAVVAFGGIESRDAWKKKMGERRRGEFKLLNVSFSNERIAKV